MVQTHGPSEYDAAAPARHEENHSECRSVHLSAPLGVPFVYLLVPLSVVSCVPPYSPEYVLQYLSAPLSVSSVYLPAPLSVTSSTSLLPWVWPLCTLLLP